MNQKLSMRADFKNYAVSLPMVVILSISGGLGLHLLDLLF